MRKRLWTILLTVFVFLSGTALGLSTVYRVDTVTVNVNYVTEAAKVEGAVLQERLQEAYEGASTLFVKQKNAEDVLKEYPYFRITGFEKSYPKRLVIDVTENAEVYAIEKTAGQEYYILSADGVVLDVRNTHVNLLNGEENVILKGLLVAVEKGKQPTGDVCFASVLSVCQELSSQLNGIRCNVVAVDLIRRSPEMVLTVTMREGVKLYISNPGELVKEKVEVALSEYSALSDAEKTGGRILLFENAGKIYADYSAVDEFAL
ncbi:MAG: hypothetical protein J6S04_01110 [Clostridia bacterium]|nr:hypothetical protein [Clostridia bacterium]